MRWFLISLAWALVACSDPSGGTGPDDDDVATDPDAVTDLSSDDGEQETVADSEGDRAEDQEPPDTPDTPDLPGPEDFLRTYPRAGEFSSPDGMIWRRAIIHLHSTHSHDACDDRPRVGDGEYNLPCLADLRAALCRVHIDVAYLTDHPTHMAETPFEDLLLHDPETDTLVHKDEVAVANQITCDDGFVVTTVAGFEDDVMPLAFDGHMSDTVDGRRALYDGEDAEANRGFVEAGAIRWTAHTESRDAEWVLARELDGLEIYNLHANLGPDIREEYLGLDPFGIFEDIVPFVLGRNSTSPDLSLLIFLTDNQPSLDTWAQALEVRPMVGSGGTDAHQNVLKPPMIDGERFDSYRRMMGWFSNYILAEDESAEASHAGLRAGRVFVAFDTLAHPDGFDAHVVDGEEARFEMGSTLTHRAGLEIVASIPALVAERAAGTETRARLMRVAEGTWEVVQETAETGLRYAVEEPGIYRVEVRITPRHQAPFMEDLEQYSENELPWIYGNAFRILAE